MRREEKKRKLIEFIERRKEERIKGKQKKATLENLAKEKGGINKETKKEGKPEQAEKVFRFNSKRRKERKDKLFELIAKKKEEKKKIKQLLVEKKIKKRKELEDKKIEERIKREQERERRKQELEEERERERQKIREQAEKEREERQREKERVILEQRRNKQNLLQFLQQKKIQNQINKEKYVFYTNFISYKKLIEREKHRKLLELGKEVKEATKKLLIEKKEREKEILLKSKQEQQKIKTYLLNLTKRTLDINKLPNTQIIEAERNITNFIKEIEKKKTPKIVPVKLVPEEKVKKVVVYKEPFRLGIFLRRNIFRFVFLILLLVWLGELFMYMKKSLISSEERLKMIVGEIVEEKKSIEKKEVVEEEKFVYWTKEKINIEGKRDPFSTGRLTMEIMKKPVPTNIIFAKKPEIISIIKTPKFVSILKPEEKISKPEKITVPKIPYVEKPEIKKPEGVSLSSKLSEIEKISKVESSPFVLPEKECPLIYRGRMILEGVEYFFIEGTKRTYRVTVGDIVEGYKILKKENNKLHLSKEGLLYEINIQ
ncbi:MAG: hypothetical protein NC833_06115 [Candidatus Omnitrophica bacterium]|nr:hypothetical protein [Candidatus Omnitrophota bacterium]